MFLLWVYDVRARIRISAQPVKSSFRFPVANISMRLEAAFWAFFVHLRHNHSIGFYVINQIIQNLTSKFYYTRI